MKKSTNSIHLFIGILILGSCKQGAEQPLPVTDKVEINDNVSKETTRLPQSVRLKYNIDKPDKCVLSRKLLEISGLTSDNASDNIYAVNDEKAYIYELQDCDISNDFDFGKNGDYEGIELVNDDIYVLKSSGKIIQYNRESKKVEKIIDTPLKTNNDTEGLGFDKEGNNLLIACKGSPSYRKHHKFKHAKAVYAYNIDTDTFKDDPMLLIEDKVINSYFDMHIKDGLKKKEAKSKLRRALKFSPSGISKNPIDNLYYVLSTVGKTLIVVNEGNEVVGIEFLDHPFFIQPEGICFNSRGDMFISNEGKGLVANVLKILRE